jgi:hypothetical protein
MRMAVISESVAMAKKPDQEREAEDKARTDEARKVVKDYADEQRELQENLRRKLS